MGCCPRKPHSLAAAWASHVLGVLTHSDLPPRFPAAVSVCKIGPISGEAVNTQFREGSLRRNFPCGTLEHGQRFAL
jgi:hypothetical protein